MVELKRRDSLDLIEKQNKIAALESELQKVYIKKVDLPFAQIAQEIKLNYDEVNRVSFSEILTSNFEKIDTIPSFQIVVKDSMSVESKNELASKIQKWLSYKLETKNLKVDVSLP